MCAVSTTSGAHQVGDGEESLLYYERLDVAELEGDLVKAIQAADAPKAARVHQRLLAARMTLTKGELASCEGG